MPVAQSMLDDEPEVDPADELSVFSSDPQAARASAAASEMAATRPCRFTFTAIPFVDGFTAEAWWGMTPPAGGAERL